MSQPKVIPIQEFSRLLELAAKVREIRQDAAEFDGDRRGIWECLEDHEKLLLEEAVKCTAPPTLLDLLPGDNDIPDMSGHSPAHYHAFKMGVGWAIEEIKRRLGV